MEGEFAAFSVTVNGTDVKDLLVQTSPGSTITGRITFDGAAGSVVAKLRVVRGPG